MVSLFISTLAVVDIRVTRFDTLPTKAKAKERMKDALRHLRSKERESLKANVCMRFMWDARLSPE